MCWACMQINLQESMKGGGGGGGYSTYNIYRGVWEYAAEIV